MKAAGMSASRITPLVLTRRRHPGRFPGLNTCTGKIFFTLQIGILTVSSADESCWYEREQDHAAGPHAEAASRKVSRLKYLHRENFLYFAIGQGLRCPDFATGHVEFVQRR